MQFQKGNIGVFFRKDPTLKLWLPFEENSGTITRDLSGNGNHGTINKTSVVSGKFGFARYFAGDGGWVDVGTGANPTTNSFSVLIWLKEGVPGRTEKINDILDSRKTSSPYTGFLITTVYASPYGRLRVQLNDTAVHEWSNGTIVFEDNKWHLISVIVDRINKKMIWMVDDKIDVVNDISAVTGSLNSGKRMTFGYDDAYTNVSYIGTMDEAAIFFRALSSQEISQYYNWAISNPKRNTLIIASSLLFNPAISRRRLLLK